MAVRILNRPNAPAAKSYWWTRVRNFGDALAPLLLSRFADLDVAWSPVADAEIVSIGSVLEHIPAGWKGYILGSGLLREESKLKFDPSQAKILALRGPLTARSFTGEFALGDPGLLASELIDAQDKQWDLGILPHWQDDQLVEKFQALIPAKFTCHIINPSDHPLTVLKEISSCRRLVTSSLHGMICADSMNIPRRVEECDQLIKDGGLFKFYDYSATIKTPFETGKMIEPERNRVDDSKFAIYDAYRELSREYGKS